MSEQQKAKCPALCKMGCGFFASEATGGCCSKCWMSSIKKEKPAAADVVETPTSKNTTEIDTRSRKQREEQTELPAEASSAVTPLKKSSEKVDSDASSSTAQVVKKKKKKKGGYKNMMAGMMAGSNKKDIAKEKAILAKGLGGGAFSKIEKI